MCASYVSDVSVQEHPGTTRAATPPAPQFGSQRARVSDFGRCHSVLMACVATLAVHLMSLTRQLGVDEGGFAMVARYAASGGGYLYGPQWVDRPPGLIAIFAVADRLGPFGVRLVACLLAVVLVAAVASAADSLGGRTAARWAAWTGFALSSSVLLDAHQLNGELAAAAFVAVSVAAVVRAVRVARSTVQTLLWGALSGLAAMAAVLVKQNFVDAFAFAGVLLLLGSLSRANRRIYRPRRVLATLVAFGLGAAVPAALAILWARSHGGIGALAYAMVGFRADAVAVIAGSSLNAPLHRLGALAGLAWLSGLLFLLGHLTIRHVGRLRRLDPLPWALAATAGVELLGVVAGENFWPHYLIALIPTLALAAGLGAHRRMPGQQWTRRLVLLSVFSTALISPIAALNTARAPSAAYTTGRWIAASAKSDDTLTVTWAHANVIDASGLRPGYPYTWSLPLRTLDPKLTLLTRTLNGAAAPTWVVRWGSPHPWGLDPGDHVDGALRAHYSHVATVCGHPVWLLDGADRQVLPEPAGSACGTGAQ